MLKKYKERNEEKQQRIPLLTQTLISLLLYASADRRNSLWTLDAFNFMFITLPNY